MTTKEKAFRVPAMAVLTVAIMIIGGLLGIVYAGINQDIADNGLDIRSNQKVIAKIVENMGKGSDRFQDFKVRSEIRDSLVLKDLREIKEMIRDR